MMKFVNKIINKHIARAILFWYLVGRHHNRQHNLKFTWNLPSRLIFLHLLIQHINPSNKRGSLHCEPDQRQTICTHTHTHTKRQKHLFERSHFDIVSYVKFLNSNLKCTQYTQAHTHESRQPKARHRNEL